MTHTDPFQTLRQRGLPARKDMVVELPQSATYLGIKGKLTTANPNGVYIRSEDLDITVGPYDPFKLTYLGFDGKDILWEPSQLKANWPGLNHLGGQLQNWFESEDNKQLPSTHAGMDDFVGGLGTKNIDLALLAFNVAAHIKPVIQNVRQMLQFWAMSQDAQALVICKETKQLVLACMAHAWVILKKIERYEQTLNESTTTKCKK